MSNSDLNTFSKQQVALVTGATGFVGSHLVRRLVSDGWQVHILSRAGSLIPNTPEFGSVANHMHDGSTQNLVESIAQAKPDVVFHLASLFLAQHDPKDIESLVLSNVLFGSQLLEAMRINGVNKIVNTGTSWQHHNNEEYNPVCLYAATKQAFEDILAYYTEATSIKAITLQLFDTYGPNDPRPKLFHLLSKTARNQESLAMSPGDQLIDIVYIDDVIDAYLRAKDVLELLPAGSQVYAVSSGKPIALRELVSTYEDVLGIKLQIDWGKRPYRPREVMTPWNKGKTLPGWNPKFSLAEGIQRTLK